MAASAPGPDAFGYTVAATTNFSFVDIKAGSPRVLWFDDDAAVTNVNLGFGFNFYGTLYSNVSFSVNGLMTFGGASIAYSNVNLTTTSPADNRPSIAVLWDDWETQSVGADGAYFKTTGTVGSRRFIVQWNKFIPVNGDGTNAVTFEARLFEDSNQILFSYLEVNVADETTPVAGRGVGATVGIRDVNGQTNNRNLQWSFNQAVITNGLNVLFNHPDADTDGDGLSNLQELTAGTNPSDANSAFRISSITQQGTGLRVTWTMGAGKTNALQTTTGAYNTNFTNLFIVTNTVGSTTNYLHTGGATNSVPRFYRVRIVP